jgi:hypothetical protein
LQTAAAAAAANALLRYNCSIPALLAGG